METWEKQELINKLNYIVEKFRMGKLEKFFKYPIFTAKVSLQSRFLHNLLKDRIVFYSTVKLFIGENMYLSYPPNYDIKFYSAYISSDAEVRLTKFLIKNVEEGDVFFDIGAAQGYYTILASKLVGVNGKVYSFEPDPFNLSILMKNKRDNVFIIAKAVTEANGEFDFYSYFYHNLSSLNFITNLPYKKIRVEGISLDDFCQIENVLPKFVKIDIEGGEERALKGSIKLLKNHSPVILMEIWFKPFDDNYKNSIDILRRNEFGIFSINDYGELDKITNLNQYFEFLDKKYKKINDESPYDNIVFMRL